MATKAVEQLVKRSEAIVLELKELEDKLKKLKNAHRDFWTRFENQCAQTFHDLTPEQMKGYDARRASRAQWERNRSRYSNLPLREQWRMAPAFTKEDYKMAYGYDCPYCRSRVGKARPSFGYEGWDGYVKRSFDKWLNQDTSNWPPEKIASYEVAKKEVEEYFLKAEPLEQRIASLNEEQSEIKKQLNTIWHMCDDILGISSRMKEESNEIISRLERKLYPHDPDAYYTD